MVAKAKLSDSGFQVHHLQDQPARWGATPKIYKRQARFIRFIHEAIVCKSDVPGCLAARMVCLDGIKPSHLKDIFQQTSVPYHALDGLVIEWLAMEPMRLERRVLSSITLKAWPVQPTEVIGPCVSPLAVIARDLSAELERFLATSDCYRREEFPSKELELDAMCWWQEALPASLFSHCSETLILSALPRTALGRLECKLALTPAEASHAIPVDTGAASELVDAAMISQGPDNSTALIATVLDILKESVSEIDGINKTHWATQIQKLTSRAIAAGPRTALLLAWATDMCESGTIDETNPADTTVSAYLKRALLPLHQVLCALPDDVENADWNAVNLRMQYQQLVASQSSGNQPTMRAALSNFHHFLVNWLDIEPLQQLHGVTASAPVRAQIVWEHELALAMQWAAEHADTSVGMAAQIMLGIAYEAPARAQELTRLKLCNISFSEDSQGQFAEVEIARHAASGRLKTPSSQRRLTVRSPTLLALMTDWIKKRYGQGAPASAFLFGDPSNDTERYRPAATLALVSRLLKSVTGDSQVSMHTLRHTAISNALNALWLNPPEVDINRIEVVAAHAGHASGLTTLQIYSHSYELALRMCLNQALSDRIEITSEAAALLLEFKPETLRKQASRAAQGVSTFAWDHLQRPTTDMRAHRASLPFSWCTPRCPESSTPTETQLTVGVMESVLNDILGGATVLTLERRYGLREGTLHTTLENLISVCNDQARNTFPVRYAKRPAPPVTLRESLAVLDIDFDRRGQAKYLAFKAGLETKAEDSQLKRGLQSWVHCYRGTYLAIDQPHDVLGLLSLLKVCSVDPNALRICVQSAVVGARTTSVTTDADPVEPACALLIAKVKQVFEATFLLSPEVIFVSPSRNRPDAYLQWNNKNSSSAPGASGGSTAGLNAVMICVLAYLIQKGDL